MLDINNIEWAEFWIDPTNLYILVLLKFKDKDNLFILDYRLQKIEEEFISYEQAKDYLFRQVVHSLKNQL
jgi:hypothetical protein